MRSIVNRWRMWRLPSPAPTLAAVIAQRDEARALLAESMRSQEILRNLLASHVEVSKKQSEVEVQLRTRLASALEYGNAWNEIAQAIARTLREERSAAIIAARIEGN